MKKQTYQKPAMQIVLLHHRTTLLAGSDKGYEVIGTDEPNIPAGANILDDFDDFDWEE